MDHPTHATEIRSAAARARTRIRTAFRQDTLRFTWPVTEKWEYVFDTAQNRVRMKRAVSAVEIQEYFLTYCPRETGMWAFCASQGTCVHVEEFVALFRNGYDIIFVEAKGLALAPAAVPEHMHDVDTEWFFITGSGTMFVNGEPQHLRSQDRYSLQAGDVVSLALFTDARGVLAKKRATPDE